MTDKLSEYGWGFQVKVVAAMFTDRLFLQQIVDIIRPDYFESDANIWLMEVISEHFREYKCPPSKDVLKVKVTEIENDILKTAVLEQLKEVFRYMESDDLTFVKDEILNFCKNQEIKRAIMDSVNLLKLGNYDEIKSKIDVAMKRLVIQQPQDGENVFTAIIRMAFFTTLQTPRKMAYLYCLKYLLSIR